AKEALAAPASPEALMHWWRSLDAPALEPLIHQAIENNLNLKIATARLRESRAIRRGAFAGLFPTLDLNGSYAREDLAGSRIRGADAPDLPPGTAIASRGAQDDFEASLDLGWELDVFGGTRRGIEAASADLEGQELSLADALVSVTAD